MTNRVHAYNATYDQFFGDLKIGKPKLPIYYGVEMEYEITTPKEAVTKEQQHLIRAEVGNKIYPVIREFAFTKHDGSLNNGFEIVTVPMSLESHHEKWNDFFKMEPRSTGLNVRKTCGMHVHVSRRLLTPFQVGKMMIFMYGPKNSDFIKLIAGRNPPQKYSEMKPKKLGDVNRHGNRYSAINLSGNNTIEFRIFKSTLLREIALKNIEFCDALVKFTWPSLIGYRELRDNGVDSFCKFVHKNIFLYPYLCKFLHREGYIKMKTIRRGRPKKNRFFSI